MNEQLADGWEAVKTTEGQVYYYSKALDRTQWERPASSASTAPQVDLEAGIGPVGGAAPAGYCALTDAQVAARLLLALTPHRAWIGDITANFADLVEKPDLLGPFWIAVTLGLAAFVSRHLHQWLLLHTVESPGVGGLPAAWCLITLWGLVAPLVVRYLYNDHNAAVEVFRYDSLVCLYGYSLLAAVPAVLLAAVPSTPLRVLIMLLACLYSLAFMIACLQNDMLRISEVRKFSIRCGLAGNHLFLFAVILIWFV